MLILQILANHRAFGDNMLAIDQSRHLTTRIDLLVPVRMMLELCRIERMLLVIQTLLMQCKHGLQ